MAHDALYDRVRGFGFAGAAGQTLGRSMSFPTVVLGDGVAPPAGGFLVDLPGGRYLGCVAFERGGFWEGEQAATRQSGLCRA